MQQPGQVIQQPQTLVRPMAPQIDGNPHLTLVGDPSGRLQMMPPQQVSNSFHLETINFVLSTIKILVRDQLSI